MGAPVVALLVCCAPMWLGVASAAGSSASAAAGSHGASGTGSGSASQPTHREPKPPALRNGHELWATIDVCSSQGSPLIGVRGSMPSDGVEKETMYMLFKVQYLDTTTKQWTSLPKGGESKLVKVGSASTTRQAGWTFQLAEPPAGGSFQLRGTVEFQWRKGSKVMLSTTRLTSSGHPSAAGAIPRGFSAATCSIS